MGEMGARGWGIRVVLPVIVAFTAAACGSSGTPAPQSSTTPIARQIIQPNDRGYGEAVRYGDLVWISGQLPDGVDPTSPFDEQVNKALDNLEKVLGASGAGFDTVIKTNVYLADLADFDVFNLLYKQRVGEKGLPARTTVQLAQIGLGYRIEIEMVAYVRHP